jgi:hypothetical protein
METLHSLQIADPAVFYRLPYPVQVQHLAHVRNRLGARYAGPVRQGRVRPTGTASRKRGQIDMMALMQDIHRHRHDPPSPRAVEAARLVLRAGDGLPAPIIRDARETLRRAGGEL